MNNANEHVENLKSVYAALKEEYFMGGCSDEHVKWALQNIKKAIEHLS